MSFLSEEKKTMVRSFIVGGVAGAISKTSIAPMERIKILLQVQASHPDISVKGGYKGTIDCALKIWREQPRATRGLMRLFPYWRGNAINVTRYFPMTAIGFATKARFRKFFFRNKKKEDISIIGNLFFSCLAGGLAGQVSLTVLFPLDVARTRITTDVGRRRKQKGVVSCLGGIIIKEGPLAIYKGYLPSVLGIFPYRAFYFGFYDLAKRYIMNDKHEKYSFLFRFGVSQTTSVAAQTIVYPLDTIRRRMMIQETTRYRNSLDCFRKMVTEEGVLSLFRGSGANVIRSVGASLCLVMYDDIGRFLFCDKDYGGR